MNDTISELDMALKIASSGLFDVNYYLTNNPDVAQSGIDPIIHYIRYGEQEYRNPSPFFDIKMIGDNINTHNNILYQYINSNFAIDLSKFKNRDKIDGHKNYIPIFFSTNEKYIPYLSVAIISLIQCSNSNHNYKIYVLHDNINNEKFAKLKELSSEKFDITTFNMDVKLSKILNTFHTTQRLSKETFFRLVIPDLFPEYKKGIYLDCDMIICDDIYNLFRISIDSFALAAARDYFFDHPWSRNLKKLLPQHISQRYINAGVLLLNFDFIRAHGLVNKCLETAINKSDYPCADQDIINIVMHDWIKIIDFKWNFTWQHFAKDTYKLLDKKDFTEYIIAFSNPAIIHFNSDVKPWHINDGHFSPLFWKLASQSPYYAELKKDRKYFPDIAKTSQRESDS